jgi:hypothetical protein
VCASPAMYNAALHNISFGVWRVVVSDLVGLAVFPCCADNRSNTATVVGAMQMD